MSEKIKRTAVAVAVYFLLSTTSSGAFQVGPRNTRSLRHVPFPPVASSWKKDENPSFASPWRRSQSYGKGFSGLQRRFSPSTASSLTLTSLSALSGKTSSSDPPSEAATAAALSSEISGAMVRLLAQFVTTELKSVIEEAKHKELVQEASQQVEQLEATVSETREAQEKLIPTWNAAGDAIQETSISNNHGENIQPTNDDEVPTVASTVSNIPISTDSAGTIGSHPEHHLHEDVDTTRNVALFDQFETEAKSSTTATDIAPAAVAAAVTELSEAVVANAATVVGEDTVTTGTASDDVARANGLSDTIITATDDPSRSVLPRIPSVISMQFGKPLPVVIDDTSAAATASWQQQQGSNATPVVGFGTTTVSPPSMSLSSAANDGDLTTTTTSVDDVAPVAEERTASVEVESPAVAVPEIVESLEQVDLPVGAQGEATEESSDVDETSALVESEELPPATANFSEERPPDTPDLTEEPPVGTEALTEEPPVDTEASTEELPPVTVALTEEELAAKYASIASLEERAFTILLDLGLIQISPDPDDPNYDHSQDDEFCAENVWLQPRP